MRAPPAEVRLAAVAGVVATATLTTRAVAGAQRSYSPRAGRTRSPWTPPREGQEDPPQAGVGAHRGGRGQRCGLLRNTRARPFRRDDLSRSDALEPIQASAFPPASRRARRGSAGALISVYFRKEEDIQLPAFDAGAAGRGLSLSAWRRLPATPTSTPISRARSHRLPHLTSHRGRDRVAVSSPVGVSGSHDLALLAEPGR